MKLEEFWVALKYGPLGLAAIATVLAAFLLFQVLKQPQVPKAKRQIFNAYMVFCGLLFVVALGATIVDNLAFKADRRMANIRELIGRLDENEMEKYRILTRRDRPVTASDLEPIVSRMCTTLAEIGTEASGRPMGCERIRNIQ